MTSFNEVGKESEPNPPKKTPCKRGKFVALILAVLIAGAVCCHIHHFHHSLPIGPKPGTVCTVQLRRDALGGASLTSPLTNNHNGADVSLNGTLIAVNREAILLVYSNHNRIINDQPQMKRLWIPKSSILLIEYE